MHPATENTLKFFAYDHLPERLQGISRRFQELATELMDSGLQGPQMTICLQKLLESKDCAIRAALENSDGQE